MWKKFLPSNEMRNKPGHRVEVDKTGDIQLKLVTRMPPNSAQMEKIPKLWMQIQEHRRKQTS